MSKCDKCRFGWYSDIEKYTACEYLLITGNVRGCPADNSCTRFEPKSDKKWRKPKTNKEDNTMAKPKLSVEEKRNIVTANSAGATVKSLAEQYKVGKSTIYNIIMAYNEHGERAFSEPAADEVTEAQTVDTKKEPATVDAVTDSDQEIVDAFPVDIIPDSDDDVKPESEEEKDEPLIPQSVIEACWARIDDLRHQIAAEQSVIDDWERQIAEIKEFLELARIANPVGGAE